MQNRALAVLLLGLALALNLKPVAARPEVYWMRSTVFSVVFPLQAGISFIFDEAKNSALFFVRAYKAQDKIQELNLQLEKALAKIALLDNLKQENQNLREALRFSGSYKYNLIPANVVGRDKKTWNSTIIINAGLGSGVRPGLTVISSRGLVGKVVESSKYASKVLLIIAPQSSVGIVLPRKNIFGIAYGAQNGRLDLQYIPESASLEVSDAVVVSAASYSFIQGIYVGRVAKVEKSFDDIFQKVEIAPETDFSKLGVVFVCSP